MTTRHPAWIATLALLLAAPLAAQPRGGERFLEHHDTDGDGAISRAELEAAAARRPHADPERAAALFARLDADGDNLVTGEELAAAHARRAGRRGAPGALMAHLDTDDSGTVSRAEWDAVGAKHPRLDAERHAARFAELDADGDGTLDAEELPRHRSRRGHHGRRGGHGMEHALAALDADDDGAVSRAEWDAMVERHAARFAELDADDDGNLSAEELKRGPHR